MTIANSRRPVAAARPARPPTWQRLQHALAIIAKAQLILAVTALALIALVTAADVAMKYLFSQPIVGAYDLVESLLPVVVFHGLPTAIRQRQNIAIDVIDHILGAHRGRSLARLGEVVGVALLMLIGWAMIGPALQAYDYGDRKLELGLPLWMIWIAVGTGLAGCLLSAIGLLLPQPSDVLGED